MRASTTSKFVFIANPKCASTSFRKALDPRSNVKTTPRKKTVETPFHLPMSNHSSAAELKAAFLERGWDWQEYFVFTTIRNPWSKVVSLYNYGLKQPKSVWHPIANASSSMLEFVSTKEFAKRARTIDQMTLDGSGASLVDMIIKVEDIGASLPELRKRLGFDIEVGHLNASTQESYRELFDEETAEKVRQFFKADIEMGGYEF